MPHSAVEGWWTGGLKARVHENWIMLPLIQHRRCKSFSNKICCPDKSESPLSLKAKISRNSTRNLYLQQQIGSAL